MQNCNKKLNMAHVVIEHTFGILKSRFCRLKYKQMDSIQNISSAVSACCLLYNLCYDPGDRHNRDVENEALGDVMKCPSSLDNIGLNIPFLNETTRKIKIF